MVENVPVSGFNIPPAPAGAQVVERPNAGNMQPGFVPPATPAPAAPAASAPGAPATYTQEQVDAMLAAARGGQPVPPAPAPSAAILPNATSTPEELRTANDPVLQSMTNFFLASAQGVDLDRAIGKALAYGDANLIDMAYLTEKGGPQAAQLAVMAKGIVDRVQAQAQAGEQAVYSQAGGKEQWTASAAVFDQAAPAHLKLVVKTMLDSGNNESISAAAKMVVEFAQNSGSLPNRPGLINAGAPTSAAQGQALDKAAFQELHRKLDPNSPNYVNEKNQLFQRRQLGKSLGL